jgi:ketosteroid isomerase-like protein
MPDTDTIAETFADALRTLETDALIARLAPGAIVWHNHDRQEVDADTTLRGIGALGQMVRDLEFETVRLSPTPEGFVMQFVVRGTVIANGNPFEMQNCVVVLIDGEQITRIDEYVDPTVATQLA